MLTKEKKKDTLICKIRFGGKINSRFGRLFGKFYPSPDKLAIQLVYIKKFGKQIKNSWKTILHNLKIFKTKNFAELIIHLFLCVSSLNFAFVEII